jgi:hypothetical protein
MEEAPGAGVIPELYGQVRTAWGKPRPSPKHFGRSLVPILWDWLPCCGNAATRVSGNPVRQASHRGMAERLASRQMLHLHHDFRMAPGYILHPGTF